jgi:hypothetical protein
MKKRAAKLVNHRVEKMKSGYFFIPGIFLVILSLVNIAGCSSSSAPGLSTNPAPASSASVPGSTSIPAQTSSSTSNQTSPSDVLWQPDGVITTGEYSGSNNYGAYTVHWRSDAQFVYIGISAKTNGWVSLALQPGSRMKDSDMLFGFVKDAKTEVMDLFCTDNLGSHPEDKELGGSNDVISFGGKEQDGLTIIEIKRLLNTGDKYDLSIQKGLNKIIWAYGSGDNPAIKHAARGYGEINP